MTRDDTIHCDVQFAHEPVALPKKGPQFRSVRKVSGSASVCALCNTPFRATRSHSNVSANLSPQEKQTAMPEARTSASNGFPEDLEPLSQPISARVVCRPLRKSNVAPRQRFHAVLEHGTVVDRK